MADGVNGDVTRLRQVMVNLLANAVKFTEDGEVVMTVEPGERTHEIKLAVRDTGIGIPADRAHRLFEEFSQLDSSTTRKYGGTGLGLAVSKRLAELMGGTMWVESVDGEGATFHFTIVAEPADVPSRRAAAGIPAELTGKSILVVDDNAINRRILDLQTEAWGLHCQSFDSGPAALASVEQAIRTTSRSSTCTCRAWTASNWPTGSARCARTCRSCSTPRSAAPRRPIRCSPACSPNR